MPDSQVCTNCGLKNSSKVYAPIAIEPLKQQRLTYRFNRDGSTAKTELGNKILIVLDHIDGHASFSKVPITASTGTGGKIKALIDSSGFSPADFIVTSLLHCAPVHPVKPFIESVSWCVRKHLIEEIELHRPKVIIAMGSLATAALTGLSGKKKSIDDLRGYAIKLREDLCSSVVDPNLARLLRSIEVVPTYSPEQLASEYRLYGDIVNRDFKFACAIAANQVNLHETVDYRIGDTNALDALIKALVLRPDQPLSLDIETEESQAENEDTLDDATRKTQILSIQLSLAEGTGWFFYWTPQIKAGLLRLLESTSNTIIGHFLWNFDLKVLFESEGIDIPISRTDDTLAMYWHYKPELGKSLAFIASQYGMHRAWKHTISEALVEYGCKDVDATLRIYNRLKPQMKDVIAENGISLWDGYNLFVKGLRPILARAERYGIPRNVDAMAELSKLIQEEKDLALARIFELVPKDILPVKQYKKWPAELKPFVERLKSIGLLIVEAYETKIGIESGKRIKKGKLATINPDLDTKLLFDYFGYDIHPYEWDADTNLIILREPFLPLSSDHLKKYLTYYGINLPINLDGDSTTGKIEIEKLTDKLKSLMGRKLYSLSTPSERQCFVNPIQASNFEQAKEVAAKVVEFIELVFAYRKYNKAESTYVTGTGWVPDEHGRIHTTFTLSATPSGQLSSVRPNVQNLTKGKDANDKIGTKLGKMLRKTLWAEPGYAIVECDYSGCHLLTMSELAGDPTYYRLGSLDAHSFLTSHLVKGIVESTPQNLKPYYKGPEDQFTGWVEEVKLNLNDLASWLALDNSQLKAKLNYVKSRFKSLRDAQAKPCIAEGELVLTNKGLVPIEQITVDHLVWDGIEWVQHEGLIYKGIKEVIEYDGLRATPDHRVYTSDGRTLSLARAASEMVRLEVTGDGGQEIRTARSDFRRDHTEGYGNSDTSSSVSVYPMWLRNLGKSSYVVEDSFWWLQEMCPTLCKTLRNFGQTLQSYNGSLLRSAKLFLFTLWCAWYNVCFSISKRICSMGRAEFATSYLQECTDRSDRQQWQLRTGESAFSYSSGTITESSQQRVDELSRRANIDGKLSLSLSKRTYTHVSGETGFNGRRDHTTSIESCTTKSSWLERSVRRTTKARVYDIANAGPRRRFTVSNKLVSNCILGNQLGLGARKLYFLNDKNFTSIQEAEQLQLLLRELFPRVPEFQERVKQLAHKEGKLVSRHGFNRYFKGVLEFDPGSSQYRNGLDAEKAIAFYVQNSAFGIIREAMLKMEAAGFMEKYGFCNTVHDSLVFHVRLELLDECVRNITRIMEEPSSYIKSPAFPDGLALKVEASVGPNWAEIEEIPIYGDEIKWPEWARKELEKLA